MTEEEIEEQVQKETREALQDMGLTDLIALRNYLDFSDKAIEDYGYYYTTIISNYSMELLDEEKLKRVKSFDQFNTKKHHPNRGNNMRKKARFGLAIEDIFRVIDNVIEDKICEKFSHRPEFHLLQFYRGRVTYEKETVPDKMLLRNDKRERKAKKREGKLAQLHEKKKNRFRQRD